MSEIVRHPSSDSAFLDMVDDDPRGFPLGFVYFDEDLKEWEFDQTRIPTASLGAALGAALAELGDGAALLSIRDVLALAARAKEIERMMPGYDDAEARGVAVRRGVDDDVAGIAAMAPPEMPAGALPMILFEEVRRRLCGNPANAGARVADVSAAAASIVREFVKPKAEAKDAE